jgi:AcrR family transcriptional regulator
MSSGPTSKLSEKRALTRQKLLHSTLEVLGEVGLHGASLDAIAKRVGVTKGAIYDNFESKDALIVAALATLPEEATGFFDWPKGREGTVGERMRRLAEAILAGRGREPGKAALGQAEFVLYVLTHEDMKSRLAQIATMGPSRTQERILELFAPEELPMPVESFAIFLHSFVPGLVQYQAAAPRPASREAVIAIFEALAGDR